MENKDRRRYYGHRVGDLVSLGANLPGETGTVIELASLDNNRIKVRTEDGDVLGVMAEACETLDRVEDIEDREQKKQLYSLRLHEKTQLKTPGPADVFVTRVPGGWLYEYQISTASILEVVFVPYNEEFKI